MNVVWVSQSENNVAMTIGRNNRACRLEQILAGVPSIRSVHFYYYFNGNLSLIMGEWKAQHRSRSNLENSESTSLGRNSES